MNEPQAAPQAQHGVHAATGPGAELPVDWVEDIAAYGAAIGAASGETSQGKLTSDYGELALVDAFETVENNPTPLLPQAVHQSSLKCETNGVTTLFDGMTGFAASITLRRSAQADADPGEVVVSFSGMTGRGGLASKVAQGIRCFLNILGLTPPKNFQQAAKLTRMMHAHIHALNSQRARAGQRPYRLTICGHSMGGAMATFASLRLPQASVQALPVKTVVINPLRLGFFCRARIGAEAMQQAPDRVTAVTVQGDWVAKYTSLYKTPIGTAYNIPLHESSNVRGRQGPHTQFVQAAREHKMHRQWEQGRNAHERSNAPGVVARQEPPVQPMSIRRESKAMDRNGDVELEVHDLIQPGHRKDS